jgi:hypothetical protein
MARPKKAIEDKYATPARTLGRVSEADWQIILAGVEASGMNKTEWMTETLIKAAKLQIKKQDKLAREASLPTSPENDSNDP